MNMGHFHNVAPVSLTSHRHSAKLCRRHETHVAESPQPKQPCERCLMRLVCDGFGLVYLQQGGLTGGIGRKRQGVGMRIVEVFRTLLSMRLGVLG